MRYAALLVLLAGFVGTAGAQTLAEAARTDGEQEVIHAVKSGELEATSQKLLDTWAMRRR